MLLLPVLLQHHKEGIQTEDDHHQLLYPIHPVVFLAFPQQHCSLKTNPLNSHHPQNNSWNLHQKVFVLLQLPCCNQIHIP